jgi:hypothetical protein
MLNTLLNVFAGPANTPLLSVLLRTVGLLLRLLLLLSLPLWSPGML